MWLYFRVITNDCHMRGLPTRLCGSSHLREWQDPVPMTGSCAKAQNVAFAVAIEETDPGFIEIEEEDIGSPGLLP